MKTLHIYSNRSKWTSGFSLVELMIVVAILGILAFAVGGNLDSSQSKMKSFVYNTKARFNQARFEAIKRSRGVYLDFDFDGNGVIDDKCTIWVDNNSNQLLEPWIPASHDTNLNNICDFEENRDCVLAELPLKGINPGPEIYCDGCGISGGPGNDGPGAEPIEDGVTTDETIGGAGRANRFLFRPNGDSVSGAVYFYFPGRSGGGNTVQHGPWAILVNSVGRIWVDEWSGGWKLNEAP